MKSPPRGMKKQRVRNENMEWRNEKCKGKE